MKFKITEINPTNADLKVAISHEFCEREVFSLPLEFAKDNKFVDEIKRILKQRDNTKKSKIDKKLIGKELEF